MIIKTNTRGFTLIEIIVVLIILGVLASLALPSLFNNIKKSYSAEAFVGLSLIKNNVLGCIQAHTDNPFANCNSGFDNVSGNFAFTSRMSLMPDQIMLGAVGQAPRLSSSDNIQITVDFNGNQLACNAGGGFTGAC